MTLEVLQSKRQIAASRAVLQSRGLSLTGTPLRRFLQRRHLLGGLQIGDPLKSWDLLRSIEFLESALDRNASILDLGCFCSEVLPILHRLGFTDLYGSDLNPRVAEMPYAETIDYRVENYLASGHADACFDAITSISVMEHGFDSERIITAVTRLLKPGGFFVASFDYWPTTISTANQTMFGMSWTIFSRTEVEQFLDQAQARGLHLPGKADFTVEQPAIRFAGKRYGFAWLVLQKRA
jgi:SAM-dependent methyltransferase